MLELNKLYNMDCMDGMREFPDEYFDLAIIDPPYGVGSVTYMPRTRKKAQGGYFDHYEISVATLDMNQRKKMKVDIIHNGNTKKTINNFGDENVSPPPEYFEELFRVSKNQIIWGGNYFLLPPTRCFIVWRKLTISESFSMAMCEYAWTSFNDNAKWVEFAPQGTKKEPRFHPTQKPVALYSWILSKYAKRGDKIIDTHAGSASSLVACHDHGLPFIGFEIDTDYYIAANERLQEAMAQLRLDYIQSAAETEKEQHSIFNEGGF